MPYGKHIKNNPHLQQALSQQEGTLGIHGTLSVRSGQYTARYAQGKYITEQNGIDYNQYHKPISPALFHQYWQKAHTHLLKQKSTGHYQVGQHPRLNVHVTVETELYWHQYLAELLFSKRTASPLEQWTLRCCPTLHLSDTHPVFIGISSAEKQILITGTAYGGEIKKSMFTIMNLLLPQHDALPLHCSAILTPQYDTALLLGLSGTGKTTLSASNDFVLIGDDEHGWAPEGIFNLEGGCYAKTIDLSEDDEPQIYHALHAPCILENTVCHEGIPDFTDRSITENIRATYPLDNVNHHPGLADHPKNIIFLCCDLYGVVPALSLLSPEQALHHFLTGYTAKIGSTEINSDQAIMPISSPCFGHPFFPLPLKTYADLFQKKLAQHNPKVWLVNTGWFNSDYRAGKRYPIHLTKAIIRQITHHSLSPITRPHPILDLSYVPSLQSLNLDFDPLWVQSPRFKQGCEALEDFFLAQEILPQD